MSRIYEKFVNFKSLKIGKFVASTYVMNTNFKSFEIKLTKFN